MKLYQFISLSVLITISMACEKEIELDADQIKIRIVVNSTFIANDTLKINLSKSGSILQNNSFGTGLPSIDDATAKLFDNNGTLLGTFTNTTNGNYYLATPFPQAGNSYKLEVTHPNYDKVTSQNFVPNPINILQLDTFTVNDDFNINISINDNPNEANYYGIVVYTTEIYEYETELGVFTYDTTTYKEWVCTKDINAEGYTDIDGTNCQEDLLFSDKPFNGTNYIFKLRTTKNQSQFSVIKTVVLKSISEELFKYRITYQRYLENQGNPFGEPVQVFSNIDGGFGIFAGESEFKKVIIL